MVISARHFAITGDCHNHAEWWLFHTLLQLLFFICFHKAEHARQSRIGIGIIMYTQAAAGCYIKSNELIILNNGDQAKIIRNMSTPLFGGIAIAILNLRQVPVLV